MKAVKITLLTILIISGLYVLVAFLAPGSYEVERTKTIHAPIEIVWEQISKFDNWDNWSPWKEKDSTASYELDGADGIVGTSYKWEGDPEISGTGYMQIKEVTEHELFNFDLVFTSPWESIADSWLTLSEKSDSTEVTWIVKSDYDFFNRPLMMLMDIEAMIGADFDRGLFKIDSVSKEVLESKNAVQIKEEVFPGGIYLGKKHAMTIAEIDSTIFGNSFGELVGFCSENELNIVGAPSCLTFKWDKTTDSTEFSIALKVDHQPKNTEGMELTIIEEAQAVVYDFYGPYHQVGEGHEKLKTYIESKGYTMTIAVEEYLNDPTTVDTPDQILTRIHYLLK